MICCALGAYGLPARAEAEKNEYTYIYFSITHPMQKINTIFGQTFRLGHSMDCIKILLGGNTDSEIKNPKERKA